MQWSLHGALKYRYTDDGEFSIFFSGGGGGQVKGGEEGEGADILLPPPSLLTGLYEGRVESNLLPRPPPPRPREREVEEGCVRPPSGNWTRLSIRSLFSPFPSADRERAQTKGEITPSMQQASARNSREMSSSSAFIYIHHVHTGKKRGLIKLGRDTSL